MQDLQQRVQLLWRLVRFLQQMFSSRNEIIACWLSSFPYFKLKCEKNGKILDKIR
jgi:hypothetical protein